MGSPTDPTWTEFPSNLEHTRGAHCYVTLFKSALNGASLTPRENIALRASSIRAIPPPSPEVMPLEGLAGVQLQEVNLSDWASIIQEVASGMREPPVTAMQCPVNDIVGILHKLEALTNQTFCRFCYSIGTYCSCHRALAQAPPSLWTAPASRATTTTSTTGAAPPLYPPPGYPPLPSPMDTTPPSKFNELLVGAGAGRGKVLEQKTATSKVGGLRQVRPQPATPYVQQVPAPWAPLRQTVATTTTSTMRTAPTTTSSSSEASNRGRQEGRSSTQGPRDPSSTRPLKRCRGMVSSNPLDDVNNYVPSGWAKDLRHIVGCFYAYYVGPLSSDQWEQDCQALLGHMRARRESEWLTIKELRPLDFMDYVATKFQKLTGHPLPGLKDFTGWI